MPHSSEIRARHVQTVLANIDRLPEPTRAAVVSALGHAVATSVEGATGLEWLPVEIDIALTHALHQGLGPSQFERFYRALFIEVFRGPVFRSFTQATRAVFGLDPAGWLRWLPEMWNVVFRNCGQWTVTPAGPGLATLILSDLPHASVVDDVWPTAVAAALSATLDIAGMQGGIDVVRVDAEQRQASFEMRWRDP